MIAVRITASLSSPIGRPPALDALAVAAYARDAGLPVPVDDADHDIPAEPDIDRHQSGIYMASVGMVAAVGHQMRWTQRPSPIRHHLRADEARRKLPMSTGAGKPTRAPMRTAIAPTVTWFALSSRPDNLIRVLREQVTHLGPRRAVGYGNVSAWAIEEIAEPWQGFPVLDERGAPLRPLPMDWPGVDHATGRVQCIAPRWMEV